jgi:hypothetical protein
VNVEKLDMLVCEVQAIKTLSTHRLYLAHEILPAAFRTDFGDGMKLGVGKDIYALAFG